MAQSKKKPPAKSAPVKASAAPAPAAARWAAVRRLASFALLTLATVVYYWPVLAANGWLWNDFPEQNFPYRLFAAVSLKHGIFPFWNPYVFCGLPFFADVQAAVLYPLNLALTFFAGADWLSPLAVEYQIVLHILLAGLFMFWLCRDFGASRSGSCVGALAFMFCGFLTAHIFHANLIHTAVWFPLVVLLFRRMLDRKSIWYCALCALVLVNVFMAGYPQLILYMYYWLGAYYVFGLVVRIKTKNAAFKGEIGRAGLFAALVALSVGMSSIQLLPTNELGNNSARPTMEFRQSCEGSVRPYRLVTLAVPNFFGTPSTFQTPNATYWGVSDTDVRGGAHSYWETVTYCGVLPLVLAALAVVFVRTPLTWFLAGIGVLSFFLAMGDSFFAYWVAYQLLPGLNRFRIPGRFIFMFTFSVAALAALGVDGLVKSEWRASPRLRRTLTRVLLAAGAVVGLSGFCVAFGALSGPVSDFVFSSGMFGANTAAVQQFVSEKLYPAVAGAWWIFVLFFVLSAGLILLRVYGQINAVLTVGGAVCIVFFDLLFSIGYGYAAQGADPSRIYSKTPLVKQLQAEMQTEFFRVNSRDSRPGTTDLGGRHLLFEKNQGSVQRLFLIEGYNPLRLRRELAERSPKVLDILNVKYAIQVDETAKQMGLGLNPTYLPRGRMVYNYSVEPDSDKILSLLHSDNFDHVKSIILEELPGIQPKAPVDSSSWRATIRHFDLNTIDVDVETPSDGFLVLSEIDYPFWKARVDNAPAKIHRADYALRAIEVPAGKHVVTCYCDSASFKNGAKISLVALICTIVLLLVGLMIERKRSQAASSA